MTPTLVAICLLNLQLLAAAHDGPTGANTRAHLADHQRLEGHQDGLVVDPVRYFAYRSNVHRFYRSKLSALTAIGIEPDAIQLEQLREQARCEADAKLYTNVGVNGGR
jgi:hypothetical protein